MSGITLDAGPLIALDRGDRLVVALLARAGLRGLGLVIPATALAQAIRAPERQALLAGRLGRFIGRCRSHAKRILDMHDRGEFLRRLRFRGAGFALDGVQRSLDEVMQIPEAAQGLFEELLRRDGEGRCPSNLRMVAHQLDIFLHALSEPRA